MKVYVIHNKNGKNKECWCEYKKLDGWGSPKNDYMWNPIICDCECKKAYKIDEYLDIKTVHIKTSIWYISIRMWKWNIKDNWNLT